MGKKKNFQKARPRSVSTCTKALLLPMPRSKALGLVLRTRLALERLRNREVSRTLIGQLPQVVVITGFITRAGHGKIGLVDIEQVEQGLGEVLAEGESTGRWALSDALIDGLTALVNEHDRQICSTRMQIVAMASNHLDRVIDLAEREASSSRLQSAATF